MHAATWDHMFVIQLTRHPHGGVTPVNYKLCSKKLHMGTKRILGNCYVSNPFHVDASMPPHNPVGFIDHI